MELSSSILKKILYFLIFWDMEFFRSSSKKEKNLPRENSLYFEKWNFLIFLIWKFLYVLKKSFSHISGSRPPPKKKIYILGNRTSLYFLIFQEVTFRAREMKKPTFKKTSYILNFLYFLKKSFYFRKLNFLIFSVL